MKKIYLLSILLISLFSTKSFAQVQNVCFGAVKQYSVDLADGANGSVGSTFEWSVVEAGFAGTINWNTAVDGNKVEIDWTTTPAATYTIRVIETNANGCIGTPVTLTVIINSLPVITAIPDVCIGNTTQLTSTGTPNAVNPWSSSDPAIATVSSTGLVTGISAGSATITFTTAEGCTDTEDVTIIALPSTSPIVFD